MRILVAPDSFKECLDAAAVSGTVADELRRVLPGCRAEAFPLADGGEGTAAILAAHTGARKVPVTVTGPLGTPAAACYWRQGGRALLDAASACGLSLVPAARRNPLLTTSRGVGELLLRAVRDGCRDLVIGLGGSGTCDGGEGMLSVPGLREAATGCRISVLCDVRNPFLGPDGAARVFGPQKGAGPAEVELLEERMQRQAARILEETGTDVSRLPGAGAAGGLGGALAACLGARLVSGIDTVLDLLGFDGRLPDTDLIITGEGKSDLQTLAGKVPGGVLRRAGSIPVVLLSGRIEAAAALRGAGFAALVQVSPPALPLAEALRPEIARENLRRAVDGFIKNASSLYGLPL